MQGDNDAVVLKSTTTARRAYRKEGIMRLRLVLLNVCLLALLTPGATAIAQTPDPTFDSDILKLLDYTGAANLTAQLTTLMTRAIMQQSKAPQGPAATIVSEVVQAVVAKHVSGPSGLTARMVPVYAKYFTHDEVRALLAFYASDIGKKTVAVMPMALQEGAQIGQAWANELGPEIKTELEKRFRAEGLLK
jgi:hypothetical protein